MTDLISSLKAAIAELKEAREVLPPVPCLKGQEVSITVFRDGQPVDTIKPLSVDEITTSEHLLADVEYLGETSTLFDDVFKGVKLDLEWRVTSKHGLRPLLEGSWSERTRTGAWLVLGKGPRRRYSTKALAEREVQRRRRSRFRVELAVVGVDFAVPGSETTVITTVAVEREDYRPMLVHPRGRWRQRKQVIREFAAELGYPGCLKVTTMWELESHANFAGIRVRDFRKLSRYRRAPLDVRREREEWRAQRRRTARDGIPF